MILCALSSLFLFTRFPSPVRALQNVTVPYNDSSILYLPNSTVAVWNPSNSELDYSKSHVVTDLHGASASFTFTGVAIYYEAAAWPYPVSANISLDGDSGTFVDLHDYSSTQANQGSASSGATTHWYRTGLKNTSHTVVISLANNATYAVMDTLIYSVDIGDTSPTWPIFLGAALGGLVLLGAILATIFIYRRRREGTVRQDAMWDAPVLENSMAPLISQPGETFPLAPADSNKNKKPTTVPASGSRQPVMDPYGKYYAVSQTEVGNGGSSGSRSTSVPVAEPPRMVGGPRDEKRRRMADENMEELPPPAYTD